MPPGTLFNGLAAHSPVRNSPHRGVMGTVQQEVHSGAPGTLFNGLAAHSPVRNSPPGASWTHSGAPMAQNNGRVRGVWSTEKQDMGTNGLHSEKGFRSLKNRGSGAQTKRRVRDAWGTAKQEARGTRGREQHEGQGL